MERTSRLKATILCDYNFSTSTALDDSFQFIDCSDADFDELARDVRAGVISIRHSRIIIAIGNQAALDNFTNVISPVNLIINAIIDRYGCVKVNIWTTSLLPRPGISPAMSTVLRKQNKGLFRAVRALVRRRKYPVQHVASHKWFLKRVKNPEPDGEIITEVDQMYYVRGTIHLNQHGLEHLYLLLAKELGLWNVQYEWLEIPLVLRRSGKKRKVLEEIKEVNREKDN